MTAGSREVRHFVLPDPENPYLLARVRWPDVSQAISPVQPDWQSDPGLFDLPYDASSTAVTVEQAAAIAALWGAALPADGTVRPQDRVLMRRMPADWSNLSRAEQRAWSIQLLNRGRRFGRRARRVEVGAPPAGNVATVIDLTGASEANVIDLTNTREDALNPAEDT